jgi:hydroxymethylbilane synthase
VRLGWEARITARIATTESLPAVSQGIIGIECRADDAGTRSRLAPLEHAATRVAMDAERAFSGRLGGSCQSPVAAHAELREGRLTLAGLVAEPDGSRLLRDSLSGPMQEGIAIGEELAERVLDAGAGALLERLRTD